MSSHQEKSVIIRFAGDSGDGVQLLGSQFLKTSAESKENFLTFPDFPAEIRAPAGTTFGVSAYQLQVGGIHIASPGDKADVLVAFNPAALITNLQYVKESGLILVNEDTFTERNLSKAGYDKNPLEDGSLGLFQIIRLPISSQVSEGLKDSELSKSEIDRTKNFWALGLISWMFDRNIEPLTDWIKNKFKNNNISDANIKILEAGYSYGDIHEIEQQIPKLYTDKGTFDAGMYTAIKGSDAMAYGLAAAVEITNIPILFCSYPITPASPILHSLAKHSDLGVETFQAEDEIAAICSAIGASYAGILGVTSSSGPGIALKTEAMGLALSAELPLVIINSQRGGPSTGLPTKTEQSDLNQAIYGRNGDAPIPVIASSSPSDNFYTAIEAVQIAIKYMTPVILLTDGYIANASEPWMIPSINDIPKLDLTTNSSSEQTSKTKAFDRNSKTIARTWIKPGTPNAIYRTGGLEKDVVTGNISYDPANHQAMTDLRFKKIACLQQDLPEQKLSKDNGSKNLILSWGSTYGIIKETLNTCENVNADHLHLRNIYPLPANFTELVQGYEKILVPELNQGQLAKYIQAETSREVISFSKVTGQPFTVDEIKERIFGLEDIK